tara:strand:+ start:1210 stop:2322 length:1113 start_codon:yes stop_codon:yes gene_type:complete
MDIIQDSYKTKLIKLNSFINKNKTIYNIVISERADLAGVQFSDTNYYVQVTKIPKKIKKKLISNINSLSEGDILIKINNKFIKKISDLERLFGNSISNIELTFINIDLYKKELNKINSIKDNKIIITQYLKDILHNELQEKNKNAIIIQHKYKDFLYKKQQYQELCEIIHDIADQFIKKTIDFGINTYLNSVKLTKLVKKIYFSKLIKDKIKLKTDIDILQNINLIYKNNLENLEDEFDEELFRIDLRHKIKRNSLKYDFYQQKIDSDKKFTGILLENENYYIKKDKEKNIKLLESGILIESVNKKQNNILKINNNIIEITNCKNNKTQTYPIIETKSSIVDNKLSIVYKDKIIYYNISDINIVILGALL